MQKIHKGQAFIQQPLGRDRIVEMQKLMKWAAFIGMTFIMAALGLVIYLGMNRVVVIADTGDNTDVMGLFTVEEFEELPGAAILLQETGTEEPSFRIPVELELGADNISVENWYTGRMFTVFLRGATGTFYKNSTISGYINSIQDASYTVEEEGVRLYVRFSELYEYESILGNGYLEFHLYKPEERYEKVVLIDAILPEDIVAQEKEILYQVQEKLSALLQQEGIRVYSASESGNVLSMEEKLALTEETGADIYLGLTLGINETREEYGSYVNYNGTYFRPWLTNGTIADVIERELVEEINGKALGLRDTDEGMLGELSIPAVIVGLGYVTHETEGVILKQEGYQDMIAEGLCQGVKAVYDNLGENR